VTPSLPTTTNNTNKTNNAHTANSANNVSVVSAPSGSVAEMPKLLAVLAVDIETTNSHEAVPVLGSKVSVSVVSGVSSEVEEWIHDAGYTCDECGGHRGERQSLGRMVCLDCLGVSA
jgi:hypothetical protein